MTREEAIKVIRNMLAVTDLTVRGNMTGKMVEACQVAIAALKAEPCEDCISRQAMLDGLASIAKVKAKSDAQKALMGRVMFFTEQLPPVTPKQRLCKDCKFFEYDHVENVDEIPLIVAHEICNKWGDGCKTKEDGYCFLFEPKMEGENE